MKFTLLLTVGLVVLVIFLFLRNVSATIIPSLALPASIVATFAVMYLLDYSLDNLSLMALTLSVGFVVDDAIVMLENIVRHMEMGKPPMQAAFDGSKEIAFTILSMTVSLAAVFIPVLFMGGMVGRLLHEFAVTIGVAILVSGLRLDQPDADAVQPLPRSRRTRSSTAASTTRSSGCSTRWLRRLRLDAALQPALPRRRRWRCRSRCSSAPSTCSRIVPKGFLPSEDQGRFNISTEGDPGHRLRRDGRGTRCEVADDRRQGSRTSSATAATSAPVAAAAAG